MYKRAETTREHNNTIICVSKISKVGMLPKKKKKQYSNQSNSI